MPCLLYTSNLSDGLPAWTYSLTYNGSYMLPETILTTVAAVLIYKAAPQPVSYTHLLVLVVHSFTLSGAGDGLAFYLLPDWSRASEQGLGLSLIHIFV